MEAYGAGLKRKASAKADCAKVLLDCEFGQSCDNGRQATLGGRLHIGLAPHDIRRHWPPPVGCGNCC